jgi:L-alanine-DL-glutamate epimerase-like enolase superfamily enzyme
MMPTAELTMKIRELETILCRVAWRTYGFVKVTSDEGLSGWSEFNEAFCNAGLSDIIRTLSALCIGRDALNIEALTAWLHQRTQTSRGGLSRQAIAAIENALLDLKGKALRVPVSALLGGVVRSRVPVYWSHCGTYRVAHADALGSLPIRSYADLEAIGAEVAAKGFRALKTNILGPIDSDFGDLGQGWGRGAGHPELNITREIVCAARDTIKAFRRGAGPDVDIHFDVNFHFRAAGYASLIRALGDLDLAWLELDIHNPAALAHLRRIAHCPIASGETLLERRDFLPYFNAQAFDVAIVDVIWNGYIESLKIAALADAHDVNVAPHNFYGHLATAISAHFCASIPNFSIMELDIDGPPERDELVPEPPLIVDGALVIPTSPGWGVMVDEKAIARLRVA